MRLPSFCSELSVVGRAPPRLKVMPSRGPGLQQFKADEAQGCARLQRAAAWLFNDLAANHRAREEMLSLLSRPATAIGGIDGLDRTRTPQIVSDQSTASRDSVDH